MQVTRNRDWPRRDAGFFNWLLALVVSLLTIAAFALACAFVAMKMFPKFFESLDEHTLTLLRILTALMVIGAGRLAYVIVRKK